MCGNYSEMLLVNAKKIQPGSPIAVKYVESQQCLKKKKKSLAFSLDWPSFKATPKHNWTKEGNEINEQH